MDYSEVPKKKEVTSKGLSADLWEDSTSVFSQDGAPSQQEWVDESFGCPKRFLLAGGVIKF